MTAPEYILIADDDEDDRFLMQLAFNEVASNPQLVFVNNGIELLNYFTNIEAGIIKTLPSLLIVDLNMPRKNGREAIKELSEKKVYSLFPTVVFSTTGSEFEKSSCESLGITHFFVKPSDYTQLLSLVAKFMEISDAHDNRLTELV